MAEYVYFDKCKLSVFFLVQSDTLIKEGAATGQRNIYDSQLELCVPHPQT